MVVLLRKLIEHLNAERFIADFVKDPKQQTQLISELVKREGRYTFNLPLLGFARKISKKMTEQGLSFSDFYDYEKKIASLLHPRLSKIGLNIYADIFIDRYFAKRSKPYLPEFNKFKKQRIKQSECEELFKKIFQSDGHRLIIALLDIFRKKDNLNKELFEMLVVLEKDVLQIKNHLTGSEDKNKKLVAQYHDRYQNKNLAGFFKTRLLWDDVLKNYLPAEETKQKKAAGSAQWQKVNEQYAEGIKNKYIDQLPDDEQQLAKVLDAVLASNKKAGKDDTKIEAIVAEIVEKCLADEKFSEAKKNILQDVFKEKFPNAKTLEAEQTVEEDDELMEIAFSDEVISDEQQFPLEQAEVSVDKLIEPAQELVNGQGNKELEEASAEDQEKVATEGTEEISEAKDLSEEEKTVKEDFGEEEKLSETAKEEKEIVRSIEIKEKIQEEDRFVVAEEEQKEEGASFAIADEAELNELQKFIIGAKKEFAELLIELSEEEQSLLKKKMNDLNLSADEEEKVQAVFDNLYAAASAENSDKYLKEIVKERGNFFARLMHHLIDMAEQLTVREMRVYVDSLITSLEKNRFLLQEYPHLIERLINFRDSLKEQPTQLLNEIYTGLKKIDDEKGDDLLAAISAKYNYLKSCLAMEKYFAVRKTIIKITENLLERPDEHSSLIEPDEPLKEDVLNKVQGELGADPLTWVNGILQGDFNEDDEILLQATKEFLNENRDILEGSGFNLKKILQNKNCPPNILQVTKKIVTAVNANKFQEAVNAIVFSANPPQIKIKFLESLKIIALKKGWLNDDPQDTAAVKRGRFLESKINYYKKLMGIAVNKKEKTKSALAVAEKVEKKLIDRDQEQRTTNNEQSERVDKPVNQDPAEEREKEIYNQASAIVGKLRENPLVFKKLQELLPLFNQQEGYRQKISQEIISANRLADNLVKNTVKMLEQNAVDEELLLNIRKYPKLQYFLSEQLKKHFQVDKTELIFSKYKKDNKYPEAIDSLLKIINKNNQVSAGMVKIENSLIEEVTKNPQKDFLLKMRSKQNSSHGRSILSSFIDLLKITGDLALGSLPINKTDEEEKTVVSINTEVAKDIPAVQLERSQKIQAKAEQKEEFAEILEKFLKNYASRSDLLKRTAEKQLPLINEFLSKLAGGEAQALLFAQQNTAILQELVSYVVKEHKELIGLLPSFTGAFRYAMANKLINI